MPIRAFERAVVQAGAAGKTLRASAAALGWASLCAFAQPPVPTPPTRDQVQGTVDRPTPDRRPRLNVEGELDRVPCALDAPEYEAIRFTPSVVEFENLKGLSAADLRAAYQSYLGSEQPLSVVCRIRDQRRPHCCRRLGWRQCEPDTGRLPLFAKIGYEVPAGIELFSCRRVMGTSPRLAGG